MFSDQIVAYIRTLVPIGVGIVFTWIATNLGVVLDDSSKTQLVIFFTGAVTAVYYIVVHWLEKRWPKAGWLLGVARKPVYGPLPAGQPAANPENDFPPAPPVG